MPPSAGPGARRLVATRALRGLVDGLVSVVLPAYLTALGWSGTEIGALTAATMLGSAVLTLAVGLWGGGFDPRRLLLALTALMLVTGIAFFGVRALWPLMAVAVVGTLNPSSGDVTPFLPIEQALVTGTVSADDRTAMFARYNLGGALAGALGALASGAFGAKGVVDPDVARFAFLLYAAAALGLFALYLGLVPRPVAAHARGRFGLRRSRRVVAELAALFSIDAFGGGLVVQSLLALWLWRRFELAPATAAAVFFAAGVLTAFSQLVSARIAARIGLIRTMVYTHLPSNVLLVGAAFMPTAPLAVAFLLARMALSQMDVPARQAYVMRVVDPDERAAAATLTSVPRSLTAAVAPLVTGALLDVTSFGWPLVAAGGLKIVYDLLLLWRFHASERADAPASR
ncbi:MAG: MFS transporter [Myxococcales bacterium]|nr:MFS transporter [Myxococcales bacterium]